MEQNLHNTRRRRIGGMDESRERERVTKHATLTIVVGEPQRDTPPAFYLVRLETDSLLTVRADLKGKRVDRRRRRRNMSWGMEWGKRTSHQQLPLALLAALANVQKQISHFSL